MIKLTNLRQVDFMRRRVAQQELCAKGAGSNSRVECGGLAPFANVLSPLRFALAACRGLSPIMSAPFAPPVWCHPPVAVQCPAFTARNCSRQDADEQVIISQGRQSVCPPVRIHPCAFCHLSGLAKLAKLVPCPAAVGVGPIARGRHTPSVAPPPPNCK